MKLQEVACSSCILYAKLPN